MASCGALIAACVVGCGAAEKLSAAQKISKSFENLGKQHAVSVKLHIDSKPAELVALSKQGDGSGAMPMSVAKRIAGANVTLAVSSDKPLQSVDGGNRNVSLKFHVDKHDAVALRFVDNSAYLHLDPQELAKLSNTTVAQMRSQVQGGPPESKPLLDLVDGQWVQVDMDDLADAFSDNGMDVSGLTDQLKSHDGDKAKPTIDPSASAKARSLINKIGDVLSSDVQYKDLGTQGGIDHLQVTAPARELYSDIDHQVKSVTGSDVSSSGDLPKSSDVPNKNVTADVYVKKGQLLKLSMDLAQFDKKRPAGGHLRLSLDFNSGIKPVSAPSGAVRVSRDTLAKIIKDVKGEHDSSSLSTPSTTDFGV